MTDFLLALYDGSAWMPVGSSDPGPPVAPALVDLEVVSALRRHQHRGELTERRAEEAFEDFRSLRLIRLSHGPILGRVWQLRGHLSAYDAAYVALAEALNAPLLTRDLRLARSTGHDAKILVP